MRHGLAWMPDRIAIAESRGPVWSLAVMRRKRLGLVIGLVGVLAALVAVFFSLREGSARPARGELEAVESPLARGPDDQAQRPVGGRGGYRGRVTRNGSAVAGATVVVSATEQVEAPLAEFDPCPVAPLPGYREWLDRLSAPQRTPLETVITDAEGGFSFSAIEGSVLELVATEADTVARRVAFAEASFDYQLELAPWVTFSGQVLLGEGGPAEGAQVMLLGRGGPWAEPVVATEGTWTLGPVPQGANALVAWLPGRVVVLKNPSDATLVLWRETQLEVEVTGAEGPVAGAEVTINRASGSCLSRPRTTDSRGITEFNPISRGEWSVIARAPPMREGRVTTGLDDAAGLVHVELRQLGELVVRLLEEGGAPMDRGTLTIADSPARTSVRTVTVGPTGTWREWLPPGAYLVNEHLVQLSEGKTTQLDVTAPAERTISGQVVDERGAAVSNRLVVARNAEGDQVARAASDSGGRFMLTLRTPGPLVVGSGPEVECPRQQVTGSATGLRLALTGRVQLNVLVLDGDGEPARGARVSVTCAAQRLEAPADDGGQVTFTLRAERCELRAALGTSSTLRQVDLREEQSTQLVLAPRKELVLAGRVLAAGRPVAKARVATAGQATVPDRLMEGLRTGLWPRNQLAVTDGEGRFEFRVRSPEPALLAAIAGELAAFTTAAPGAEVVLEVSRPGRLTGRVLEHGKPVQTYDLSGQSLRRADGRFELGVLRSETRTLIITAPCCTPVAISTSVTVGQDRSLGDIEVTSTRVLEVWGPGVEDARFVLLDSSSSPLPQAKILATSRGTARIEVPQGEPVLVVVGPAGAALLTAPAGTGVVRVEFQPGAAIVARALPGPPRAGQSVRLSGPVQVERATDARGRVVFLGLPTGTYELTGEGGLGTSKLTLDEGAVAFPLLE